MNDPENQYFKNYKKEKLELDNDIFENEDDRRGRPEFFMPPGTEVLKLQEFLEIDLGTRSKNKKSRRISTFLAIYWNLVVMVVLVVSILLGAVIGILISSVLQLVGAYLILNILKSYLNSKKVIVDKGKIKISEKPITLFTRYLEVPTSRIKQLYTSKYFTGVSINEKKVMAYSLSAITDKNRVIRLVDESNLETILYLEQEIERFLDMEDEAVHGEILDNNE